MRRAAENRAFAVAHQHEIGGIDRQQQTRAEGVDGEERERQPLLLGRSIASSLVPRGAFGDELRDLRRRSACWRVSGWSAERAQKVAPKMVSWRVV